MMMYSGRRKTDGAAANPSSCSEIPQEAQGQAPKDAVPGSHRQDTGGSYGIEAKTGDLAGVFGYDIYYNKTNYELAYTVEYVNDKIVVVIMAGTRENFYDELKRYMS